ncbi:YceI family protein [Pedobacter sandarakinus]|uniref:YceI family protein n=1 Tax=Pedobacter sandarakinus TaxID=353156 RepID=UPI0022482413|nr:YceI family protein [Pedobacter sandarakinus]MCX2573305.1 YceI family protein [Pedobacter sandarakinus]
MKKNKLHLIVFVALFLIIQMPGIKAQNYISNNVKISFYSSTPIEDIKAASNKTSAVLIAQNGAFAFQVAIKSFEFEKKLMQEHFNENYMESDKFPYATFKGSLSPNINWKEDGEYKSIAKGILTLHGVSKPRSIPTKVTVKNGVISVSADFEVACSDHDIDIPTLVFTKIAKVISVKVNGTLNPKP